MGFVESYFYKYEKRMKEWSPEDKPTIYIILDLIGIIVLTSFIINNFNIVVFIVYIIGFSFLLLFLIYEVYNGINYSYGYERKFFKDDVYKIKKEIEELFKEEKLEYIKYERKDFFNKSFIRTIYFLNKSNTKIILNNSFGMVSIYSKNNQKLIKNLKEKIDNKLKKYEFYQHESLILKSRPEYI